MKKLFYDNETTGIPLWGEQSGDPRQPHIVQLAAILVDMDTRETIKSVDVIVKPVDWVITPEMTAIHGISHEQAMDVGISEADALNMLLEIVAGQTRIGHNESFDARITRIAIKRYLGDEIADLWKAGQAECTARLSRSICALPKSKVPTLTEAYTHFFGRPFENAHTAMADALACRDVYFAVQDFNEKLAA
jgi:DNA polymerase-3 subunit epsilon